MKILLCGANGFIGSHLLAYLLKHQYYVKCCTRHPEQLKEQNPFIETVYADFNTYIYEDSWTAILESIDVVINCVGILHPSKNQNIENIHYKAPLALYNACHRLGVKRVIHISALGVESNINVPYVQTKSMLDHALLSLNLSAVILRPSLLYASGAFGGTSFFRALSTLPLVPLIDEGKARFQPLAMIDFLAYCKEQINSDSSGIIEVVGPKKMSTKQILTKFRYWLGFGKARFVNIPLRIIKLFSRIGNYFSDTPMNMTSLKLLMHENIASGKINQVYHTPLDMDAALSQTSCSIQNKLHARLYFARWFIFISLFILWLLSGLIPLATNFTNTSLQLIDAGLSETISDILTISSCCWDISLAFAMFFKRWVKPSLFLQIITIISYTLLASILKPILWIDPLGPLLKNIPILALTLSYLAIYEER